MRMFEMALSEFKLKKKSNDRLFDKYNNSFYFNDFIANLIHFVDE